MAKKKIETIIAEKIYPYALNEKGQADLAQIIRTYSYDLLVECIDIGVSTYFRYDENGKLRIKSIFTTNGLMQTPSSALRFSSVKYAKKMKTEKSLPPPKVIKPNPAALT